MERLREAINKAKAARGEPAARAERAAGAPRGTGAAREYRPGASVEGPAEQAWAALPEAQTSQRHLRRHRVITDTAEPALTTMDLLRTKIIQQTRDNGWKRLVVTSPTLGCGKTTLCCNLALSFARQNDFRVLICDLDLRRPSMAAILGIPKPAGAPSGFGSVLNGDVRFADQAVRIGSTVALSMNFAAYRNPGEILLSNAVAPILSEIEAAYRPDLMIFDCPPLLSTDDTLGFLRHVDCALLIAGAEVTSVAEVDTCERELAAQTNVIGTVLNKCRFAEVGYGYGYGGAY